MNLTTMCNSKKAPEIASFLRSSAPNATLFHSFYYGKAFNTKRTMIAPYTFDNPGYASVSGTAFDYLARFEVAKQLDNQENKFESLDVIAKYAFDILWYLGYHSECRKFKDEYDWSIEVLKEYITGIYNHSDKKIIDICCFFAHLELIVRSGRINTRVLGLPSEQCLYDDLKLLIEGFRDKFIGKAVKTTSIVVFNPRFTCFRHADADIFIDDTLYDFKTTKSLGFNSSEVMQIWGYFLLHEIDNKNKELDKFASSRINKIALYKARCADIDYVNVQDVKGVEQYRDKMQELLIKYKVYAGYNHGDEHGAN